MGICIRFNSNIGLSKAQNSVFLRLLLEKVMLEIRRCYKGLHIEKFNIFDIHRTFGFNHFQKFIFITLY